MPEDISVLANLAGGKQARLQYRHRAQKPVRGLDIGAMLFHSGEKLGIRGSYDI